MKNPDERIAGSVQVSRRKFMCSLSAAAVVPVLGASLGSAQSPVTSVLPLNTPGVDHLDVVVPDVEAAARFYTRVFNTRLHGQPFQGATRYFILLSDLPESRQVGYVAIGASNGRGISIGHFCTSVFDYRRDTDAIRAEMTGKFEAAGFGTFSGGGGFGGIFADPDGIEIQFLPAPDLLVGAAVPSDLVPDQQGMVTPQRVDHVHLHVSDLESAVRYYRVLYGPEAGHRHGPDQAWFEFTDSRIVLEEAPYQYGESPSIVHFGIKVDPFDREEVAADLVELGAEVLESPDEPEVLRFRDLDGITVELVG
jgi:catechol 2,3-dioxygenase-like lactoylglutathione lyase family enzyme